MIKNALLGIALWIPFLIAVIFLGVFFPIVFTLIMKGGEGSENQG